MVLADILVPFNEGGNELQKIEHITSFVAVTRAKLSVGVLKDLAFKFF